MKRDVILLVGLFILPLIFVLCYWQFEILWIHATVDLPFEYSLFWFGDLGFADWVWRDFWWIISAVCFGLFGLSTAVFGWMCAKEVY